VVFLASRVRAGKWREAWNSLRKTPDHFVVLVVPTMVGGEAVIERRVVRLLSAV